MKNKLFFDIDISTNLNEYGEKLIQEYDAGRISLKEFMEYSTDAVTLAYTERTEPWAQSGHGGDALSYRFKKMMILEAVYHSGRLLDIGSANGYLVECLTNWSKGSGLNLEFHGLEISPELTALSQYLWPHLKDHFFQGNALDWEPKQKYDYVHTMIFGDLPVSLRGKLIETIFEKYLKPQGRLIIGDTYAYESEKELIQMGYHISGYCQKKMSEDRIKKIFWIDKAD